MQKSFQRAFSWDECPTQRSVPVPLVRQGWHYALVSEAKRRARVDANSITEWNAVVYSSANVSKCRVDTLKCTSAALKSNTSAWLQTECLAWNHFGSMLGLSPLDFVPRFCAHDQTTYHFFTAMIMPFSWVSSDRAQVRKQLHTFRWKGKNLKITVTR